MTPKEYMKMLEEKEEEKIRKSIEKIPARIEAGKAYIKESQFNEWEKVVNKGGSEYLLGEETDVFLDIMKNVSSHNIHDAAQKYYDLQKEGRLRSNVILNMINRLAKNGENISKEIKEEYKKIQELERLKLGKSYIAKGMDEQWEMLVSSCGTDPYNEKIIDEFLGAMDKLSRDDIKGAAWHLYVQFDDIRTRSEGRDLVLKMIESFADNGVELAEKLNDIVNDLDRTLDIEI